MKDGGAVDIIQRPAIDKQLVDIVGKYAKPESTVIQLDNALIPRHSSRFREIEQSIGQIAQTNANCIIFGESGMGKEQIASQIYFQSSRTQKPIIIIEAGGAELVGLHDPTSDRNEIYNRIKKVCSILNVFDTKVRSLKKEGRIGFIKCGKTLRFSAGDVYSLLERVENKAYG